jgi:alkanesulfonate monooxygenase SsuD/methylene tetrahydromethanopterin reductase-like flavin-dependent oxidoreductase (luciferase family)
MNKEQNKIKFGCYIYQEGLEYEKIKQIVIECEKLGFDSVWLKDNFGSWLNAYFSHRKKEEEGKEGGEEKWSEDYFLECWTTLSSLATITKRIRLGAVLVNLHRSPSLTAKMVSTLDVISNGRIDFGLSAGWHRSEIESYGLLYPSKASIRVEILEESIQIIKKMISKVECEASFKGKYYSITKAQCKPAPVQKPWPRLWIGGGGEKTLKLVAKYGDGWIYGLCTYNTYVRKASILNEYCGSINRDGEGGEVIKAWHGIIYITDDAYEQVEIGQPKRFFANKLTNSFWKNNLDLVITGTPEYIIKEMKRYIDIGVDYFIIHFIDLPSPRSLRLFAKYIMPHFLS